MGNLASLAAIAQLGGVASSAGNAYSQSNAQRAQGSYQSSVFNQNAQLAATQGEQAMATGAAEAALRGERAAQVIGAQRAAIAGGAVDVNTGSAAKVQEDTRAVSAADQAQIMQNAALQRWGYGIEAAQHLAQARMAKSAARFGARSAVAGGIAAGGKDVMNFDVAAAQAGWFGKDAQQQAQYMNYGGRRS